METTTPQTEIVEEVIEEGEVRELNLHKVFRHFILISCILLAISIIIFLIYQNGKSIYDQGI